MSLSLESWHLGFELNGQDKEFCPTLLIGLAAIHEN